MGDSYYAKSLTGKQCKFPFEYKGITYTSCAKDLNGTKFCITTENKMERCDWIRSHDKETVGGHQCQFPMVYKGKKYNECVFNMYNGHWCYYDGDKWDYCKLVTNYQYGRKE